MSLNSFDIGEYLAVKENYSILRAEPNSNASILDTIFDNYHSLSFLVIKENSTNNFVNVKVISNKWSNGAPDPSTRMNKLPNVIEDGKEGWIHKSELFKHPVPDGFIIRVYQNNEAMLMTIIENAEWHSLNNKKDYPKYKSEHASCYLILGKKYYEADSAKKAIYYLTKSIQILPRKTPYIFRALAKIALQDYQGAISDCTRGILLEQNPIKPGIFDVSYLSSYDLTYDNIDFIGVRGFCYLQIKNYISAISDLTVAIKNDNNNGQFYYYRGFAKYNSGQKISGCKDFSKAGELGYEDAYDVIKSHCNK